MLAADDSKMAETPAVPCEVAFRQFAKYLWQVQLLINSLTSPSLVSLIALHSNLANCLYNEYGYNATTRGNFKLLQRVNPLKHFRNSVFHGGIPVLLLCCNYLSVLKYGR